MRPKVLKCVMQVWTVEYYAEAEERLRLARKTRLSTSENSVYSSGRVEVIFRKGLEIYLTYTGGAFY